MRPHFVMKSVRASQLLSLLLSLTLGGCGDRDATQDNIADTDPTVSQPAQPKAAFADQVAAERESIKAQLADAVITTNVKAALLAETTLSSTNIEVVTLDGVVTLTGDVESLAMSERASEVSRAITHVKQVSNALTIRT